jgi:hypothetical protein
MSQSSALREQPSMDEILASIRKIIDAGEAQVKPPVEEKVEAAEVVETVPPSPANDPVGKRPAAPPSILPQQPLTRRAPEVIDPAPRKSAAVEKDFDLDIAAAVSDYLAEESKAEENKAGDAARARSEPNAAMPAEANAGVVAQDPLPDADSTISDVDDELDIELDLSIDMSRAPEISEAEAALLEEFSGIDRDLLADRQAKYEKRFSEDDVGTFRKVGDLLRETVNPTRTLAAPAASSHQSTALVSDLVSQSVSQSLASLSDLAPRSQAPDLDAMAEEMLRPMLQEWLDNNLPSLVERLVRAEIERIARGDPRGA